jgi:hypothetical protein
MFSDSKSVCVNLNDLFNQPFGSTQPTSIIVVFGDRFIAVSGGDKGG